MTETHLDGSAKEELLCQQSYHPHGQDREDGEMAHGVLPLTVHRYHKLQTTYFNSPAFTRFQRWAPCAVAGVWQKKQRNEFTLSTIYEQASWECKCCWGKFNLPDFDRETRREVLYPIHNKVPYTYPPANEVKEWPHTTRFECSGEELWVGRHWLQCNDTSWPGWL